MRYPFHLSLSTGGDLSRSTGGDLHGRGSSHGRLGSGGGASLPRRPYGVTGLSHMTVGHMTVGHPRLGGSAVAVQPTASHPHPAAMEGAAERVRQREDELHPERPQMRAEAVLLVAKNPLTPRKLAQLAHLADATEARTLVRQLNQLYEKLGRAVHIEQVAGGFRMLTRPALAPWLTRLGHLPQTLRLSTPMMETLAVVAYRQPVSRAAAEAVRGVACGELLRQLMERDLIRIAGRSEELGRPYLYGTTNRFLQLFGLPHVDALPPIQWHTLHEDPSEPEFHPDDSTTDSSTSPKEPVVSTTIEPIATMIDEASMFADTESTLALLAPQRDASHDAPHDAPTAVDDDDDDDWEDDDDVDDDDDDDWDDDDEEWDDDEEDDAADDEVAEDDEVEEDVVEEEVEEDELEEDEWEEVDDDDDEEWDEDDDEEWEDDDEEDDAADDDEDWE
jgi:segregation and condensation protein B